MKAKIKVLPPAPGYDLAAKYYDEKTSYLNSFEKAAVFDLLGDLTGKKILDAGAGTGRLSLEFSKRGAFVTALDASGEMLKILARKSRHLEIVPGDAESLPFPNDTFDMVVAAFLIVHLKNPSYFFREAYRVLKSGGILLVTNINQKEPPEVKTAQGPIKIESYYHRPEKIRELLAELALIIEAEKFVKEGGIWVNQIVVARK